jgi:hypothetical protein
MTTFKTVTNYQFFNEDTGRWKSYRRETTTFTVNNGLTVFLYFANLVRGLSPDKFVSDRKSASYDIETDTATFVWRQGDNKTTEVITQK